MLLDLPVLVLELVCGHLSYEDVLMLRSVCKGLKKFVDEKQWTKVNLFVGSYSYHRRLFYTGDPTGHSHSLHSDDLTILESNRFQNRFVNVQRMCICRKKLWPPEDTTELDLTPLNCFTALSHLEVDEFSRLKGRLSLKELRIAAFVVTQKLPSLQECRSSVEVDCPRLRALKIWYCWPALSSDTDQFDYLDYDGYFLKKASEYLKSISPNLRKVSTICFKNISRLSEFLTDLKTGELSVPSLNELKLEECCYNFDLLEQLAASLEDLKRDLRTKRIRFSFNGRPINSSDELRQIISMIRAYQSEPDNEDRLFDTHLRDRSLLFLNETPELRFLLSSSRSVQLREKTDLNEEMIRRLKRIEVLGFGDNCQPSFSAFERLSRTCLMLRLWQFDNQVVIERLLAMLSKHLVNLLWMRIMRCKYETLKPLVKFRNLQSVDFDFDPEDELAFLFENSRTLTTIQFHGKIYMELQRNTMPESHKIRFNEGSRRIWEFQTLSAMIAYFHEQRLFEEREDWNTSTRLTI